MGMEIAKLVENQHTFFNHGGTKKYEFRLKALTVLKNKVKSMEKEITDALYEDLGRSELEAYTSEIATLYGEIDHACKNLKSWMEPEKVASSSSVFPASCYIVSEPYGVALIMAPWNYPFMMALYPLVGAIAAGNCIVIKPSAYAPKSSALIRKIIESCYPQNYIAVVEGSREENTLLLEQNFDYIFFTGSVNVGKVVMAAAAKNLTPVTLELGGKNPVIVDATADLKLTAKRIVNAKFMNCGQTCVAPDYVMVEESVKGPLLAQLKHQIDIQYGKEADGTIKDYPRTVNRKHFDRIVSYLEGQEVVIGGKYNEETLQLEPTVILDPALDSPVMSEEIFGPIIPVIGFKSLSDMEAEIRRRPKPLAAYLFSSNKAAWKWYEENLSFGGGCINDCMLQVASQTLPFGGVGASGMGCYHGKFSFDTFSNKKSIVNKNTLIDFEARYRPFTEKDIKMIRG